jgi:hypothetical protein
MRRRLFISSSDPMKKFLAQLLLFSAPLFFGWMVLLNVTVPKEFAYGYIGNECEGQGRWLYSRLFLQDRPADVVFIGASRTMRAVDDSLLQHYSDSSGSDLKFLNAGFCRFGRDLFTLIAEDALKTQTGIKTLVFEVNEREGSGNHPIYWSLAGANDLLYPESFVNQSYFSNVYSGSLQRVEYLRDDLFGRTLPVTVSGKYFGCLHTDHLADADDLDRSRDFCASGKNCAPPTPMEVFQMQYNKAWIARLSRTVAAQDAQLVFLFLPAYGCSGCPPRELEFYSQYGKVLIPPAEILENRQNWSDHDHFNSNGSRLMAKWLFAHIASDQE